jgi:hypothetical protein
MTKGLAEIHDRITARAFMAVHNPERGLRSGGCWRSCWRYWIGPARTG